MVKVKNNNLTSGLRRSGDEGSDRLMDHVMGVEEVNQMVLKPESTPGNYTALLGEVYNAMKIPMANLKTLIEIFTDEPGLFTKENLLSLFRNIKPSVYDLYNLLETLAFRMDYLGKNPEYQPVRTDLPALYKGLETIIKELCDSKGLKIEFNTHGKRYVFLDRTFVEKIMVNLLVTVIRIAERSGEIGVSFKLKRPGEVQFVITYSSSLNIIPQLKGNSESSHITHGLTDENTIMLILEIRMLREIIALCGGDLRLENSGGFDYKVEFELPCKRTGITF